MYPPGMGEQRGITARQRGQRASQVVHPPNTWLKKFVWAL
jgi:hypothetical protein